MVALAPTVDAAGWSDGPSNPQGQLPKSNRCSAGGQVVTPPTHGGGDLRVALKFTLFALMLMSKSLLLGGKTRRRDVSRVSRFLRELTHAQHKSRPNG
jgi:hypothetical protein